MSAPIYREFRQLALSHSWTPKDFAPFIQADEPERTAERILYHLTGVVSSRSGFSWDTCPGPYPILCEVYRRGTLDRGLIEAQADVTGLCHCGNPLPRSDAKSCSSNIGYAHGEGEPNPQCVTFMTGEPGAKSISGSSPTLKRIDVTQELLSVVECKDFNSHSTGKVGRKFVDAPDSKRHDLGVSIAIICSNSGFTSDALRKAKRKRIGMISVLRKRDRRVKVEILEEILLRRVCFGEWRFTYHGVSDIASRLGARPALHWLRFDGRSLDTWLQYRALVVAMANPSIKQGLRVSFEFKEPLAFSCGGDSVSLRAAEVSFVYNTTWLCQTVCLDAILGLYGYLRGRIRLAPGENQYVIQGINWDTSEPCDLPEELTLLSPGLLPGEIETALIMHEGLDIEEAPELRLLEPYVVPRDLECKMPGEA